MTYFKKNWLLVLIIALLFNSCDIQKRAVKSKTDRTESEQTETITKRKGDTVTFTVPKIVYRDTTIYTVNRQGTTLRTVYDNNGTISQIDCFASMIDEISRSNRLLVEAIKEKDKEKTETFNPQHFIYAIAVLALILLVGFIVVFRKMNMPL